MVLVRDQGVGHYRPYAMNGNIPSEVLAGEMQFKLVMYCIMLPKASAARATVLLGLSDLLRRR
jgi:hypothetical protein